MTPEKARRILAEAVKDGCIPQSSLKVLAAGAARSGKTLSKKHAFKMKCNSKFSPSTGVTEAPIHGIRSISYEIVDTTSVEWEILSQDDLLHMLALKLRHGYLRGKLAEVVAARIRQSSSQGGTSFSSDATEDAATATSASGKSKAEDAMVQAYCDDHEARVRAEKEEKELFRLQMILFLDSGGQPQYHEVLPALSHNVCLVILFLKLNERLDALCCTAFTDEKGEWFEEQCPSLLTNEQMLVQFVHTMMCKPLVGADGTHTMVMFVGTYKDLIHECSETLAQKNERLRSLFLPTLKEVLIMNGDYLIFAVNALEPDTHDEATFGLIRSKVSEIGFTLEQITPLSFFMILNDLIKYGEEHGKRVVSMEECQAIAGRLQMDRQSLEAALYHFNNLSMLLYTPSVLPGLVFVDPQMPLDTVNKCVTFSYQVGCGKVPGMVEEYCQFWREGEVSSEMLEEEDVFSSCFVPGVFEAEDALRLFHSLYIVAPLSEGQYIMPAVLQTISDSEVAKLLPPSSDYVEPLLLHFHKFLVANGTFCSTHACIRSKYDWTTCRTLKGTAECLYRNAVKLQHPTEPVEMLLIHALKHFEVYVTGEEADIVKLCPKIRAMLVDSVDHAADAFRYTNSRATVAFLCPCSSEDRHTAIPVGSRLKCTVRNAIIRKPMTEKQRVWLSDIVTSGMLHIKCVYIEILIIVHYIVAILQCNSQYTEQCNEEVFISSQPCDIIEPLTLYLLAAFY